MIGTTGSGDILMLASDEATARPSQQHQTAMLETVHIQLPAKSGERAAVERKETFSVRMPRDGAVVYRWNPWDEYPVVSPQGDRLAWLVESDYTPPGSVWLRRVWVFLGQRKRPLVGLWISRVDGSHMQEIGHLNYKPGEEIPQDIRWTPDGKRLSFLYKGGLYTVPVDEL